MQPGAAGGQRRQRGAFGFPTTGSSLSFSSLSRVRWLRAEQTLLSSRHKEVHTCVSFIARGSSCRKCLLAAKKFSAAQTFLKKQSATHGGRRGRSGVERR